MTVRYDAQMPFFHAPLTFYPIVRQLIHWLRSDIESSRWHRSQRRWRRRLRYAVDLFGHADVELREECHPAVYQQ
jgi:hypothetical protein